MKRLKRLKRLMFPPEKPWEAPGDVPIWALLAVLLFLAIYLNSYAGICVPWGCYD